MNNTTFESVHSAPRLEAGRPVFDTATWLRLPRAGSRCTVSGLSRSTLAELVRPCARNDYQPQVDARILKRKGTQRGVLLINRAALLAFIEEQPTPSMHDSPSSGSPTP